MSFFLHRPCALPSCRTTSVKQLQRVSLSFYASFYTSQFDLLVDLSKRLSILSFTSVHYNMYVYDHLQYVLDKLKGLSCQSGIVSMRSSTATAYRGHY